MAGMNRPVGLSIGCGLVRDACEEPAPGGLCGLPPVCSVPESVNRVQPTPGRAGGVAGSLGPLGARAVQVRSKCMERKHVQSKHAQGKYASNRGAAHRFSVEGWQIHCTGSTGNRWSTFPTQHMEALLLWFDRSGQRQRAEAGRNKSIGWAERGAKTNKLKQAPRLLPRRAQRGPGLCRWGAPGRAGRPGPLGVATRESLISPGVAGRGSRVGDPPRPCQPCRADAGEPWSLVTPVRERIDKILNHTPRFRDRDDDDDIHNLHTPCFRYRDDTSPLHMTLHFPESRSAVRVSQRTDNIQSFQCINCDYYASRKLKLSVNTLRLLSLLEAQASVTVACRKVEQVRSNCGRANGLLPPTVAYNEAYALMLAAGGL